MFQPVWFGKYLLLDKIARGGMAEIYLARLYGASGFEKELVIKRILPEWSTNESFLAMLIDEAKLAVLLTHSNIVQIHELGKEGNDHYIAMEYVDGVDLRRLWEKTAAVGHHLPFGISLYIMGHVLDGLSYAHRKKNAQGESLHIIHRDISPQNILISFDGAVKLTDFGIAKATLKSTETVSGIHKGKFAYMSPEQANLQELDQSSDLFSTGIVFYELLTGQRLFGGGSDIETLDRIRKSEVRFNPEDERRLPEDLRTVVMKALARRPEDRFPNAAAFAEAVNRLALGVEKVGRERLADFMEDLFSDAIREKKRRREERKEIEKSLTIALPSETTRVLVTQSGQREPPTVIGKKGRFYTPKPVFWVMGIIGILIIAPFLLKNFSKGSVEVKKFVSEAPSQPPSVIKVEKKEAPLPQPPQPASQVVLKEAEGSGFLSVLAIPWAYVSIDEGERRESPVQKITLKTGRHLIRVFYEPESTELSKTVEVKADLHTRCIANFEDEEKKSEIRCKK